MEHLALIKTTLSLIDFAICVLALCAPAFLLVIMLQSLKQTKLLKQQNENLALLAYQLGKK